MASQTHKAGFINLLGKPNVGKSTIMNALVGERLSIITNKAQTTRHRIMGILSGDNFQMVYSDTPGIIDPSYLMQKSMMRFVQEAQEDADVLLFVTDLDDKYQQETQIDALKEMDIPIILVLNKIDLGKGSQAHDKLQYWKEIVQPTDAIMVSAQEGTNIDALFEKILEHLPEHPPFFDKEELTDKSERFFASEIIREKIFFNYKDELPYSTEVGITSFKEEEKIIRIYAEIYVERDSQKKIIIGSKGEALKTVGMQARKDLETFFQKKVFLEQHVKVIPKWRRNSKMLQKFGYQTKKV